MNIDHSERKNICTHQNIQNSQKKCSIKNHNQHDKNTILHNFNIFNFMVTLHSCCVFELHFHGIITWFEICFVLPCVHTTFTWYLHNYKKITHIYIIMTYETKKEVNKRLFIMHNIKMTPSLLFSHAKCKRYFSIFVFCININY
jgi:hypothetical protein